VSWDALVGQGVHYAASPAETQRFGVSIGRVTVLTEDAGASAARLAVALRTAAEDVLVVRYPATEVGLGAVIATCGRDVIPAGALTYWGAAAIEVVRPVVDPQVDVISAAEWAGEAVDGVVDAVVAA
jgi:hypothetical protein